MVYGMLATGSYLLTDIASQFHEDSKMVNSVERLTRHLNKGDLLKALSSYIAAVRNWTPSKPVIHIDDSDVVKPDGYKFETLDLFRNDPKSTEAKNSYEKGYHITEACALTDSNHLVSIFSWIHSSKKEFYLRQRHHLLRHGHPGVSAAGTAAHPEA